MMMTKNTMQGAASSARASPLLPSKAASMRSVKVQAEGKAPAPRKLEEIPENERMFSTAQWNEAVAQAPAMLRAPPPKPVSVREAFAFSGPLPEKANGRLAMLGFVAAMGSEFATGQPVFTQFSEATGPVVATVVVFTIASLAPLLKGSNPATEVGPFTPQAELSNSRFAMVGMASLLAYEYFNGTALF
ncbi:chloroplast carotene biosynthesis-related protein [Dunaliella salina]|uniref:Chloroplast carotene biosynthesis-related protein n=1 Tax=Dunaliella salina TaxID=3046 RepID=A0ABQ7GSV5_DUNSA|nr:chloroplast carotene biosynthesis-related protein [Dunaliella salina]|eukprot:KAF5837692.1 chloroplast carotene biosynthesis-related protein [Dunaliella salina]